MTKTDIALTLQYPQLGFQPGTEVTIDKEVLTLEDSADLLTWTVAPASGQRTMRSSGRFTGPSV